MGDSGSQLIGFFLAALGLSCELDGRRRRPSPPSCCRSSCSRCRSSTRRSSRSCGCSTAVPSRRAAATTARTASFASASRRRTPSCCSRSSRPPSAARASRTTCSTTSGSRVVGVLVTAFLLVQFASFLADVERRGTPEGGAEGLSAFSVHARRLVEVIVDFGLITGAFAAAYAIRFGWPGTVNQRHIAEVSLPIVIAARYVAFVPFGLYRSIWRYAGSRDLTAIASAVVLSEVVAFAYLASTRTLGDFSRSFFIIDALICVARRLGLPPRRADDPDRGQVVPRPHRQADDHRRRRSNRAQPDARAARDVRRARARLRRRQPTPATTARPRRAGARRHRTSSTGSCSARRRTSSS